LIVENKSHVKNIYRIVNSLSNAKAVIYIISSPGKRSTELMAWRSVCRPSFRHVYMSTFS